MIDNRVVRTVTVDGYTLTASRLTMKFNETVLATGTCFGWELENSHYLITNWHNVTGRNPQTGRHLADNAAEPNILEFDTWDTALSNRPPTTDRIFLYRDDQPIWLEHPIHAHHVDVVCIPLSEACKGRMVPINKMPSRPLKLEIADNVFILGFPVGIGADRMPIWKRASVASEPEYDIDQKPKFLVDTATMKGMSGAPVIRREVGGAKMQDGNYLSTGDALTRFVGIYSGRVNTGEKYDAQLGVVWKDSVINEIISGGMQGKPLNERW